MLLLTKKVAEHLPYAIGRWASLVPYSLRLGPKYEEHAALCAKLEAADDDDRLDFVVRALDAIVGYAQKTFPFYQDLYGTTPLRIRTLHDFLALPHITRAQVRNFTRTVTGAMLVNTGGSTGGPISFYLDRDAWAREWAHMHYLWGIVGYTRHDLMLTMLGKPLRDKRIFQYNAVHNEFLLDPYANKTKVAAAMVDLLQRYPIRYFQGYPSNIYHVFKACETVIPNERRHQIGSRFAGLLFSSEYPAEHMTDYLRNEWGLKNQLSWYGHTEMCVLACDQSQTGDYHPLHSYGFCEVVDGMLMGTSFNNLDMPLIRYRTEDIVDAKVNAHGMVTTFRVTGGRTAEFVEDSEGALHSATFFVGRHHSVYNLADFVQIYQERPGQLTYFIVPSAGARIDLTRPDELFDLPKSLPISFDFKIANAPVRTRLGKLKLKLNKQDLEGI